MDVTPLVRQSQKIIQSYAGGVFRISGQVFEGGVFVLPEEVLPWPEGQAIETLTPQCFQVLADRANEFDVVLLGTGAQSQLLMASARQELRSMGLMVEAMDTGAACRTFNVLTAEARRVAAALLPC